MTIDQAFNASVDYYDGWMRKAVPSYDDVFSAAVGAMPFEPSTRPTVLDLGAGTGLFSLHVLQKYPQATFVLYDVAEKMLAVAQERFRPYLHQFRYVTGDYRTLRVTQDFDLVISSLSIHHLADEEKAALFRSIYRVLRPGGLIVNVDQVRGETEWLRRLYWERWLAQVRQSGAAEDQIRASIERRTVYDRDATLADQLAWLRQAGFENVDCVYKNYFIAVFLGCKANGADSL